MASKPPAKTSVPRTAVVGARSTTTPKPSTIPASDQRSDMTEEQSLKPPALYRAPHARTAIPSRANWKSEGLRTYSRIPLHLRNDVPAQVTQKTRDDNRSDNKADQNDKVTANKPFKQTQRTHHINNLSI